VAPLFDRQQRSLRRDRAARTGPELFLVERAFEDCVDRIALMGRMFEQALLIGCFDRSWPGRLEQWASRVDVREPAEALARRAGGTVIVEDEWEPLAEAYDVVLAVGTLDTVGNLPLALQLIRQAMRAESLLLGAMSGGHTLPALRSSLRAADMVSGAAAPHVHPRVEASALAPLLQQAGFIDPVVDIDRIPVAYSSLDRLVADLRAMGATNVLTNRPRFISRAARSAARDAFAQSGHEGRTVETFEVLHFAAWTPNN
jgi:hypothetical protein